MSSSTDTTRRSSIAGITSILSNNGVNSSNSAISSTFSMNSKNKPQVIYPRIQENQLGESIQYRNQILSDFKELGQPDLVHLSRYDKSTKQEIGEYHYVTGINTSSVIQPFMYLQTIQLSDKESATSKHNKIGTYCCYNIFNKGDLRIRCQFPGSASPMVQFVPSNKNKITINISKDDEKSQNLWLETYVSSLIRSILFSDSIERHLPGMCKFNPMQSTKDTKESIKLLCKYLDKGPDTGSNDIINRVSYINNYLVDALFKILSITNYYELAIEEIEKIMINKKINLNVLIVRILILKNDYAKAVRLMHDCLIKIPRDGWMLNEQTNFLIDQNRPDLALIPSIISVECLPSEFLCWKNLIKIYIMKKDLKNALLALNSSPMYSNKRKDIYSALKPKGFEFPFPLDGKIENIWKDCELSGCISGIGGIVEFSNNNEIEKTNKYRLRVYEETKLNCTFKEAYDLLALMIKQSGWGELLKIRSKIFVMEDEYNEIIKNEQEKENNSISEKEEVVENNKKKLIELKNSSTLSLSNISNKFKSKRLSEKWLDSLFLILYENVKNVLIYQNDLISKPDITFNALEWELIGEECFKIHFYEEGLIPFDTCLNKRFSIFACYKILRYFIEYSKHEKSFQELNIYGDNKELILKRLKLDNDYILKLCCKLISWNSRFYGEFPIICFEVFKILSNMRDYDFTILKSNMEILLLEMEEEEKNKRKQASNEDKVIFKDMESSQGVGGLVDRYLGWLKQFEDENDV
ncbi:hypothetical protein C6P42_003160 [Pichia californica]|nr:hypothetical protein C6P42_003160 [[Candida] californica]